MVGFETERSPPSDVNFELLRELTETNGVPGYEDHVREIVRWEFDGAVDSIHTDAIGNVVGTVEQSSTSSRTGSDDTIEGSTDYEVAVAPHVDERGTYLPLNNR